jgi:hypothetical protein
VKPLANVVAIVIPTRGCMVDDIKRDSKVMVEDNEDMDDEGQVKY